MRRVVLGADSDEREQDSGKHQHNAGCAVCPSFEVCLSDSEKCDKYAGNDAGVVEQVSGKLITRDAEVGERVDIELPIAVLHGSYSEDDGHECADQDTSERERPCADLFSSHAVMIAYLFYIDFPSSAPIHRSLVV